EDGIRDGHVTGVQTCALPILRSRAGFCSLLTYEQAEKEQKPARDRKRAKKPTAQLDLFATEEDGADRNGAADEGQTSAKRGRRRSEERRVGKEGREGR